MNDINVPRATGTSIQTPREHHDRYCHQPEGGWLGDMAGPEGRGGIRVWGRPGDVRRCVHGKVMIGIDVPGVTPAYWHTLSPIFNPIKYRRAVRVLRAKETHD